MKCEKVIKEISAYIDGEVGLLKRLRIERHLKTCNQCRKKQIMLENITFLSRKILVKNPDPGFYELLRQKLPLRESISSSRKKILERIWKDVSFYRKAAFLAGAAAVLFFVIFYLKSAPSTLPIEQFEQEYLRSKQMLSVVEGPFPSAILISEQNG